jgi:hypothetical protein
MNQSKLTNFLKFSSLVLAVVGISTEPIQFLMYSLLCGIDTRQILNLMAIKRVLKS